MTLALAHSVNAQVRGHAIEPGRHFRLPGLPIRRRVPQTQQAVLRDILSLGPISEHPKRLRKHQRRQTRRQNLRCCAVAFSKPRQKFRIFKILTRIKGHHLS